MNRLHSHYVPILTGALMNQRLRPPASLFLRHRFQQVGRDKYLTGPSLRSHEHEAGRARLVPKPIAWHRKDKNQDQPDDDVVLPGGAGEIPKDKPSEMGHSNIFA